MDKTAIKHLIHSAHENMAAYYGALDIHGGIHANTLEHWNYLRNVEEPISRIVRTGLAKRSFVLLDAGCGNGQLFHLYTRLGAGTIFGVDFSRRMLDEARKRAEINHVHFIPLQGRLEDLGFIRKASFDLINLYGIIEHLPEPIRVLKELERLIVPGGLLILAIPRKWSLAWLTYFLFCRSLQDIASQASSSNRVWTHGKMSLYRFYTAGEIDQMLMALKTMRLTARIPIAHGGILGPPAKLLEMPAVRGRYKTIDLWNHWAKKLKMVPAGEYIALRKE